MRWLMIGLLVSLGALLFAAAGLARHIWLQRKQLQREPVSGPETTPDAGPEAEP
jgi:uncharacterized protein YneF (UPF0154 family)